eukprot:13490955-Ditylum_brightwellii.AAC.1
MLPLLNKHLDASLATVKLQHDSFPEANAIKHSTCKQSCLFEAIASESGEGGKQLENDVTKSKDVAPSQIISAFHTSPSQTSRMVLSKVPSIAPSK